jgi:hypothetical protein
MASYRASIRSQQNSQLRVQVPQFSLSESGSGPTSTATQSLMAGFGRMTQINTSVQRSSFTSRPESPLQSPSPAPVEVELIPALSPAERAQRDLEQDRKDAERELQRYEEAGIFDVMAERTADIVRFWEVRALLSRKVSLIH